MQEGATTDGLTEPVKRQESWQDLSRMTRLYLTRPGLEDCEARAQSANGRGR